MSACINCGSWSTKVVDSRKGAETGFTVRRRVCEACGARWRTLEVPAEDVNIGTAEDSDE